LLFALVGVANTTVDVAAFWILAALLGMPALLANVISFSLGALNSFVLNALVTFRHRTTQRRYSSQRLFAFTVVTLVCLGLSTLVLALALPFLPSLAAKLVSVVATLVCGYALNSWLVFR
jgi:putative flippase GtrA